MISAWIDMSKRVKCLFYPAVVNEGFFFFFSLNSFCSFFSWFKKDKTEAHSLPGPKVSTREWRLRLDGASRYARLLLLWI